MRSLFALGLFVLMPFSALAQVIEGSPFIAVHGEAKVVVIPDLFPLEVTLEETSTDTAATQSVIEALARQVVDLAVKQGVDDADLTVGNLSISPEYDYDDESEKQIFLGNTYSREIEVKFHSLDALRAFLAKIPEAKQVRIETGEFRYSKAGETERSLFADAIADARVTAETMAKGVDKRLGEVHTISNRSLNVQYSSTTLDTITVVGTGAIAPGDVVLTEGRITLDQDVYIVYHLVD